MYTFLDSKSRGVMCSSLGFGFRLINVLSCPVSFIIDRMQRTFGESFLGSQLIKFTTLPSSNYEVEV